MRHLMVALLGLPAVAEAGVVINEFVANPATSDDGLEWIELYNNGSGTEDLSGWEIERATSSFGSRYTIPGGTMLAPDDYLVIGGEFVGFADLNLDPGSYLAFGNAGSSGDAIRIVDSTSAVIDTVIYGPNNSDGFLDDTGGVATTWAPTPGDDQAIARIPNGVDTNDIGADFEIAGVPTPGSPNEAGGCDEDVAIVINELLPDPTGSNSGTMGEWVELYNPTGSAVDLSGWQLVTGSSDYTEAAILPPTTTIEAGEFLVVGQSEIVSGAVVVTGMSLRNASSSSYGLRLEDCADNVIDSVVYGEPNDDGWIDDTGGAATSLAPTPVEGVSIERHTDGVDTDLSGDDFQIAEWSTPGSSNDEEPPPCGADLADVVINELFVNPVDTDDGFEWVELYNAGESEVDLSGWILQTATSTYSDALVFPADTAIASGDYLLLGGDQVGGADFVFSGTLGNASGSADAVRLTDCSGVVADTVVYGSPNEDAFDDDTGNTAASLAPDPQEGASLARIEDGYDTDQSALDFVVDAEPTPGSANPVIEPVECVPSTGTVKLNEVFTNPAGTDDGLEWIELYNSGSSDAVVDGWGIAAATQADGMFAPDATLPVGSTVPAGGFLVVGGEFSTVVDVVIDISIPNGSGGDGVRLFDCQGATVDTVVYGSDNEDGIPDDAGAVVDPPSPDPGEEESLARVEDGVDSDSPDDWKVDLSPSPGETNYQEIPDIEDPDRRGCGCNRGAPDGDAPSGGCGGGPPAQAAGGACSALPFAWLWPVLALGLGLCRRRSG